MTSSTAPFYPCLHLLHAFPRIFQSTTLRIAPNANKNLGLPRYFLDFCSFLPAIAYLLSIFIACSLQEDSALSPLLPLIGVLQASKQRTVPIMENSGMSVVLGFWPQSFGTISSCNPVEATLPEYIHLLAPSSGDRQSIWLGWN